MGAARANQAAWSLPSRDKDGRSQLENAELIRVIRNKYGICAQPKFVKFV